LESIFTRDEKTEIYDPKEEYLIGRFKRKEKSTLVLLILQSF
jgi:hypothetical protein